MSDASLAGRKVVSRLDLGYLSYYFVFAIAHLVSKSVL
jgi:hypothetical protein